MEAVVRGLLAGVSVEGDGAEGGEVAEACGLADLPDPCLPKLHRKSTHRKSTHAGIFCHKLTPCAAERLLAREESTESLRTRL
eukprot:1453158-Rhodomonas_salina.1